MIGVRNKGRPMKACSAVGNASSAIGPQFKTWWVWTGVWNSVGGLSLSLPLSPCSAGSPGGRACRPPPHNLRGMCERKEWEVHQQVRCEVHASPSLPSSSHTLLSHSLSSHPEGLAAPHKPAPRPASNRLGRLSSPREPETHPRGQPPQWRGRGSWGLPERERVECVCVCVCACMCVRGWPLFCCRAGL